MYLLLISISLLVGYAVVAADLIMHKVKLEYVIYFLMILFILVPCVSLGIPLAKSGFKSMGFYSLGGVLGGYIAYVIMGKITPEYKREYLESFVIAAPIMYGIGKIGCSIGGCCGGRLIHGAIFPVQKVEAVCFIIAFVISCMFRIKNKYDAYVAVIVYTLLKIVLDFFRFTHNDSLISMNQILCGVIIVITLACRKIKLTYAR